VIHTDDKELLKKAAKAAGIEFDWCHNGVAIDHGFGEIGVHKGKWVNVWNPLTDDGDALRLAVQLGLDIEVYKTSTHVYDDKSEKSFQEDHDGDQYSATRKAIVRAAVEIGKGM
jgi:hypothetical protein